MVARVSQLAGKPIEQHSSPNQGGAMDGCLGLVLHIAQGSYRGTISWQLNPDQRYASGESVTTCSTWIVGREVGEWAQMVDTTKIAWCQRSGSRTWLSIELAGFAPASPSAWQIEACAQLLAWAHQQHGVPLAVADHPGERGLGHHAMDRESLGEEWGHDSCPGTGVIAAKSAIVARAKAIEAGEVEDMTPQQAQQLRDAHYTTAVAIPSPTGEGRVPLHVWAAWMTGAVKALAAAVGNVDEATKAQLQQDLAALRAGVEAVPGAVVAELPGVDSDEELAARLRALLGDRAAAVGALLASPTA